MRILHVHKYYHDHDGAGRYMFDVMRLSEVAGHVVAPFAMHDPRNSPSPWDKYFVSSLDTSRIGFGLDGLRQLARAWWSREAYQKISAMLKAFKPDVVHLHNIYTHLSPSVLAACREQGVPVIMTVHDYALVSANYGLWDHDSLTSISARASWLEVAQTRFIKNSFLATALLDGIYRLQRRLGFYDRVIEVYLPSSEFVKKQLVAAGYPEKKIRVLPLFAGNLLGHGQGADPLLTSPLSKGEKSPQREGVLFAGRLEDYKGIDLFLQAASAFPNVKFYSAGTGPLEGEVIESIHRCPNLSYLGFVSGPELWAKMAEVELVVVPSRWAEPFGLVAVEAMACGTPVLVSDAGGLPEKLKAGANGLIFKAGDIQDLTTQLKIALKNPADLKRMGQGAARFAKAQANPDKHMNQLFEAYAELVIHK